jgi:hypothetical protein
LFYDLLIQFFIHGRNIRRLKTEVRIDGKVTEQIIIVIVGIVAAAVVPIVIVVIIPS